MSWLAAMVAAVMGLAGLPGSSLAASQTNTGGTEWPTSGYCGVAACADKPQWAFGGFDNASPYMSSCYQAAEPTGVRAPVYFEQERYAEAEFQIARDCYNAVWVAVSHKYESSISVIIDMERLYSISPSQLTQPEDQIAPTESGPLWSGMLDAREGCIVAMVRTKPTQDTGYASRVLTEMEWGNCVPPGTQTATAVKQVKAIRHKAKRHHRRR